MGRSLWDSSAVMLDHLYYERDTSKWIRNHGPEHGQKSFEIFSKTENMERTVGVWLREVPTEEG
jgi:hypothetical protein